MTNEGKTSTIKARIIGFTKYKELDWDCIAVTDKGERILINPFVGCAWEYENRVALVNTWIEMPENCHTNDGVFLPSDIGEEFRVLFNGNKEFNRGVEAAVEVVKNIDGVAFERVSDNYINKDFAIEEIEELKKGEK